MNQVVMMNNFISAIRSLFSSAVTKICLRGKGYGREFAPLLPRPRPWKSLWGVNHYGPAPSVQLVSQGQLSLWASEAPIGLVQEGG